MTIQTDLRTLFGLSSDVVSDDLLNLIVKYATDWCNRKASAYHVTPPESAIVLMSEVYLRQNLDLRGIKPSSINMPGLSMSTDVKTVCDMLTGQAEEQIKAVAYANGSAVKHIRSGKVALKWR